MILHLNHPAAFSTDQELRRMGVTVTTGLGCAAGHAADERRQPLYPVDQALFQQEIECAIDGGRGCATPALA